MYGTDMYASCAARIQWHNTSCSQLNRSRSCVAALQAFSGGTTTKVKRRLALNKRMLTQQRIMNGVWQALCTGAAETVGDMACARYVAITVAQTAHAYRNGFASYMPTRDEILASRLDMVCACMLAVSLQALCVGWYVE